LSPKNQSSIARMLVAMAKEDYERLAYEYVDLAPFNEKINVDLFAKDLRELIAPYYGLTLKNVNLGKILMTSAGIAARHHLTVPSDMMLFFKSIVSIESIGRKINKDFDFLKASLEFAGDLAKTQMDPNRFLSEAVQVATDSKNILFSLPRQVSYFIRKLSSPDYATRVEIRGMEELKKSIEVSFNLLFLGLIIGALILSASFVATTHMDTLTVLGIPVLAFSMYIFSGLLSIIAFFNYIKKP
jgi:ubiquinone biosynthesis protein